MDYEAITAELQKIVDKKEDKFYQSLLMIVDRLEKTDDLKLLKVVVRFKSLITQNGDPFSFREWKLTKPELKDEIIELIVKLIDFLNDHFEFLKPYK